MNSWLDRFEQIQVRIRLKVRVKVRVRVRVSVRFRVWVRVRVRVRVTYLYWKPDSTVLSKLGNRMRKSARWSKLVLSGG